MKKVFFILILISSVVFVSCKKDSGDSTTTTTTTTGGTTAPQLIFKFKFDSTQVRLNNIGQASTIPSNHSALSPVFNKMSSHYIELAQTATTALGAGKVLYHNAETTVGGTTAIDFSQAIVKGNGETFFSVPLSQVGAGTFQWIRVSLSYQNYDIKFKSGAYYGTGTIASFVGYNTYLTSYMIKTKSIPVSANKLQGYWGFETNIPSVGTYTVTGQAPPGATTVPNPIFATSPIPQGSCVVTGQFVDANGNIQALTITGTETSDIVVTVSLSTNKSFEWKDANMDGWYEPAAGDTVVDMGLRGLIPYVTK